LVDTPRIHSEAERATVNSLELWIKVSVGDDRLISGLATISATIRHVTSCASATGVNCWSLSAIERVTLRLKKKAIRVRSEDVFCAWKTREKDQPCIPIHSIANTARFVKCWIVYWIPRKSLSGDPKVSVAAAVTTAWRIIMELSDDAIPWRIIIEVIFHDSSGIESNLFFSCQEYDPCTAFAQLTIFSARYSSHLFNLSPHCIFHCACCQQLKFFQWSERSKKKAI